MCVTPPRSQKIGLISPGPAHAVYESQAHPRSGSYRYESPNMSSRAGAKADPHQQQDQAHPKQSGWRRRQVKFEFPGRAAVDCLASPAIYEKRESQGCGDDRHRQHGRPEPAPKPSNRVDGFPHCRLTLPWVIHKPYREGARHRDNHVLADPLDHPVLLKTKFWGA